MSSLRWFVALSSLALFAPSFGQEESAAPLRVVREHFDVTVAADGSSVVLADVAVSPQTPAAVRGAGRISLPYQEGRSEVDILEAYSLKPDGTRHDVQPDRILTQVPPAAAQAPAFADGKVKVLLFPDVAVGDQVVYKLRLVQREPKFAGQFSGLWAYARSTQYDDVRIVVRAPPKITLHVDSRDLVEQPSKKVDGYSVREWRFRNDTVVPQEPGTVDPLDFSPRLVISTFGDWGELAKAYESRAAAKSVATDEIRRKAVEIVGGRVTERDKAKAIYEWVTSNVRYVAVYLGAGGYVPHAAEEVLRNRYGDCKDYAALLGAMLESVGIESTPVLLNLGARFSLPSVASPEWFNHVMVWVPKLGVYLDATGRVLPFGTLGEPAMDKAALPTRGYKAMLHTPLVSAAQHAISTDVQVVIGEDGRGKGEADVSGTGSFAAALRNMLENAPPAFDTQYASAQLARAGLSGNGTVTRRVSPELDSQPGFSVKFETGNWLTVPGPGAFRLPTGLFAGTNVRSVSLGLLNSPPQKVDRRCMPTRFEEKLTLDLPEGLMPKVPANAAFSNRVARYEAHYVLAGRKLTVTRTLEMSFDHVACTPEEGGLLRDAAEALRRDVEAQVLY